MAYIDWTKGGMTMGYNPPLQGEFGDVLGRPNINNIIGDNGYQEMLRRTSPAPRTGPVPETQIDRMVKALTGTNPSKAPKDILVKKPTGLARNFPNFVRYGNNIYKTAVNVGSRAVPYIAALGTGYLIGEGINKISGRPHLWEAMEGLPEAIKMDRLMKKADKNREKASGDNKVDKLTNELNKNKSNTRSNAIVNNSTNRRYITDSNGNVILPALPSTALTNDLPNITEVSGNVNKLQQNATDSNKDKLNEILKRYETRLAVSKPYIDALSEYINNYGNLQERAYELNRFNTALAGLSGNQGYKDLKYSPAEIEATRLDLMNKLFQLEGEQIGAKDELIGRAALAEAGNIPIEAILADKDTFKAMSPILSSINSLKGRTYATDINNQTKLQVAKMKLESDMAIAKANRDVRAQIAIGNQLANVNRALITSMGFNGVSPVGLADIYNQMGYGNIDTSKIQGSDLQSVMNDLGL